MVQSKSELKAQGKANKAAGARFEKKVREQYEEEGWIVTKWHNNIDLDTKKIIKAKNYYIPRRGNVLGSGFPDFVMFRKGFTKNIGTLSGLKVENFYKVMFIEAKLNGLLSKEEKLKLKVMNELGHKTFVAYEDKSKQNNIRTREFIYTDEKEKIPRN